MKKPLLFAVLLALGTAIAVSAPPVRTLGGKVKETCRTERKSVNPRLAALSPRAKAAPANAVEVPFKHTLGKAEADKPYTDLYVAFDSNNDGKGWKIGGFSTYSACLGPDKTQTANDDWMISPPVHLLAGKEYTLSFEAGINTPTDAKEGLLSLWMGASQTVEAMTSEVVAEYALKTTFALKEVPLAVDADGYYHFGFHSTTTTAKTAISTLKNFSITEKAEPIDPPAAGKMSYVLAPKGELKAIVTYTAPTHTQGGAPLESISKVEIKSNWELKHTFDQIAPGETQTCEVPVLNTGYNKLEAIAYIDNIPGEAAVIKDFYAGPDNPLPVEGVKAVLSEDYKHVTLSWEPVGETGESGGYVDTEKVIYYVFDAFGSYTDPPIAQTEKTSITFDYSNIAGQDFVAYQVTAGVDEMFYSLATSSDIVTVGEPSALPFCESFANAEFEHIWAIDPESTPGGAMCGTVYDNELQTNADDYEAEPVYLNSHDGDNGFFYIMPMEKDAKYGLISTKISLAGASNPVLEYHHQGKGSIIDVLVSADGGDFVTAHTLDLKENPTDDWTLCRVPLDAYKDSRFIQVELRLTAAHNDDEYTWSVPLDNIRIRNLAQSDLRAVVLKATAKVKAGNAVELEARVENLGTTAAKGAWIEFTRDGTTTHSQPLADIEAGKFAVLKISEPTGVLDGDKIEFAFTTLLQDDANAGNNTAKTTATVIHSQLPGVESLEGEYSGSGRVSLSWAKTPLDGMTSPRPLCEDFESDEYAPLTIEDFGDWTMVDADKKKTYTFMDDKLNPYRTSPMAFQVYDPVLAGVPQDYRIDVEPHSGDRFLAAWSCKGLNDNWLISPELDGSQQTISFFAKSFTFAYAESFEVLYSSTGRAIEDFTKVEVENYPADNAVPEVWTEFKAQLPAGAKYFAIRHTSYDTYALFIDDIAFSAAPVLPADLALQGFNIYHNGEKVSDDTAEESSAVCEVKDNGSHEFRVSAVYNHGESRASEPVVVDVKGVNAIAEISEADGVTVTAENGTIIVEGAENRSVAIAGIDGRIRYNGQPSSTLRVCVEPGVYIVNAAAATFKVLVL